MKEYILLLPLIFIFHDMEEIAGFGWFFRKNPWLFERFPKVMNTYRGFTNEGFTLAVYEEFIPFFGVSLLTYFFPCNFLYGLWYGIFLSLFGHFFIHIGHSIHIRKYIPCVATSVICVPVSAYILIRCAMLMNADAVTIIAIVSGIILMIANFYAAHGVMHYVNRKISKPADQLQT